jgi:hypothetical protein
MSPLLRSKRLATALQGYLLSRRTKKKSKRPYRKMTPEVLRLLQTRYVRDIKGQCARRYAKPTYPAYSRRKTAEWRARNPERQRVLRDAQYAREKARRKAKMEAERARHPQD